MTDRPARPLPDAALPEGVLVIRPGVGANCSSVGSVVDMLFVAGVAGGALLLAVNAALGAEAERSLGSLSEAAGEAGAGEAAGEAGAGEASGGAGAGEGSTSEARRGEASKEHQGEGEG